MKNWKFFIRCLRLPHSLKFGNIMSLSGRKRQTNVPRSKTHVWGIQSHVVVFYFIKAIGESLLPFFSH